jgi:hypothetical protein
MAGDVLAVSAFAINFEDVLGHVQWRDTKTVLQAQETTKRLYCTMECL